MPRSSHQKAKLLYLQKFLLENTDEEHPATMREILAYLESNGIPAERKSIYDDLEELRCFGLETIKTENGKNVGYFVASRDFELPELKLLVDSVQSSKFITQKKSIGLIRKIERLASVHQASQLDRQVFVGKRIKVMNESIYYNVDEIHSGITQDRKIRFRYFEYTVHKERRYRREGAYYVMSPLALSWDDENYYLIAYDSEAERIKHFRVDKMENITLTDEKRDGRGTSVKLDTGDYARKVFGMFGGEERSVRMRFTNDLVGAVIDRLGRDVFLTPDGDTHFVVHADVEVSPQFFAWLCGFGADAELLAPEDAVKKMREHIKKIAALYSK